MNDRERDEWCRKLQAMKDREPEELIRGIAVSCASFIAAIDADSRDVAAYLEQRLAPLQSMARVDYRCLEALKRINGDARQGSGNPGGASLTAKLAEAEEREKRYVDRLKMIAALAEDELRSRKANGDGLELTSRPQAILTEARLALSPPAKTGGG